MDCCIFLILAVRLLAVAVRFFQSILHPQVQPTLLVKSTFNMSIQKGTRDLNLLHLPAESVRIYFPGTIPVAGRTLTSILRLRNQIWSLCLKLPENTLVGITERASFSCNDLKEITPALLRVNHQMHHEAKTVLYSQNTFGIRLNEGSCMRKIMEENPEQHKFAIPSLWNSTFRKSIYQIRRLHIMVALGREELKEGLSREEANYQLQQSKGEFSEIVKNAVEELCNVLALSSCLTNVVISFCNNSRQSMRTDKDHRVLQPLGKLRGLKEVEIFGVPKNFASYLEDVMKREGGK